MDAYISSSTTTSSINNYIESTYSGIENLSIEEFQLAQNGAVGVGAAAFGVIMSIAVAALIRFFSRL